MTKPYKKKLIEVAIPLEAINAGSAHEKMPGIGAHPRGIHHWWARRPLVAARAVLFAQLVDDPTAHLDQFPTHEAQEAERRRLFDLIEELAKWENSSNEDILARASAEIKRSCGDELPSIYDPFSGGGAIPLEAQRLGLAAYGSDLNPVAVMIGKAMTEFPPRFKNKPPVHPGVRERNHYRNVEGLAEDVRYYGEWMLQKAISRIGHLYPKVSLPKEYGSTKAPIIAWIWSRTVPSPDPAFSDTSVPIASTFLLSSKDGKEAWLEPIVDKVSKKITYRVHKGGTKEQLKQAKNGTKVGRGSNFSCLLSGAAIPMAYVREAAEAGQLGTALIAIVADGKNGRIYLPAIEEQSTIAQSVRPNTKPNQMISSDRRAFTPPDYGMKTFGDLFLDRQLVSLNEFSDLLNDVRRKIMDDSAVAGLNGDLTPLRNGGAGSVAYAEAVSVYLAFAIDRCADFNNALTGWSSSNEKVMHLFGRQAIPMAWDFAEANILEKVVGGFEPSYTYISKCIERLCPNAPGQVNQVAAQSVIYPKDAVISTDPPYYDNIGYADLSDFFFCWLRPALKDIYPDIFGILATPKSDELVAAPHRHGGNVEAEKFFIEGMTSALKRMHSDSSDQIPATIYYAFKQSEIEKDGLSSTGWATFLHAVIEAGFSITGTWPMRTEQTFRMRGMGSNALANSVVLVCRKKVVSAEVITRAEFIRALKRELPPAIKELQAANIAPADMPQSAIGPGMGVFSRYKAVLESDDSPMSVKSALQLINRELGEHLEGIQGDFDADTRFAITWFEQNALKAGDYGTANSIAQARGISVESVKYAGIVESQAGKVRILRRDELDENWEPGTDQRLTIWECLQHLVRLHEKDGISNKTTILLKKIGEKAEDVKDLAYILYDISANKRQDAKEATAYNALIADWTELSRQAAMNISSNQNDQMQFRI